MALVSLHDLTVGFGAPPLLDAVSLRIEHGQRIGLLGRNGTGKSTLLKVLDGRLTPQGGTVFREPGLRTATFDQTIPVDLAGTCYEIVARGLGPRGDLLLRAHAAESGTGPDRDPQRLQALHEAMETHDAWSAAEQIARTLARMNLEPDTPYATLSGGRRRRVLLAAALVREPDLLLLDEPTNHLDIETITWLEETLLAWKGTLVFVTHDRALLRAVATRIVEIDRGALHDAACDYDTFVTRRRETLEAEAGQWQRADRTLAQEEHWIRRGVQGRRRRNEGRVRALEALRAERHQRRQRLGTVKLRLDAARGSGTLVIATQGLCFGYDERPLVRDLDVLVTRGDKIGILGPNGCGKTTLLRLLLGTLAPRSGSVRLGTNLEVTYMDQLRAGLDETKTVWENVQPNGDSVTIDGRKRHVIGYLEDFLFTPERAKTRLGVLSGGERSRVLLARLFARPTNLLVLDEPTNDLDAETLELLEALLVAYEGTLLMICHDRTFLDNVVTNTWVFQPDGTIAEHVGGYRDTLRSQPAAVATPARPNRRRAYREARRAMQPRRLSFQERRELEILPERIEALEAERGDLHATLADPVLYQRPEAVVAAKRRLAEVETACSEAYARWETLETLNTD